MYTFNDQMGNTIKLPSIPKRIVSLVPSQTELLFDLGLEAEVVGITKFCIHPKQKVRPVAKVGGTKDFKLNLIRALQPDLIIGNKEENEEGKIRQLQTEFPVWMSDIATLPHALQMISLVGNLVGRQEKAQQLLANLNARFGQLKKGVGTNRKKVLYLIWRKPFMAAGSATFIDHMLQACGFENAVAASRYPELSAQQMAVLQPDEVFLSSEPYPFKQPHIDELSAILPGAKVRLVDGEMFSWYGSRLLKSADYFLKEFSQLPS